LATPLHSSGEGESDDGDVLNLNPEDLQLFGSSPTNEYDAFRIS